MGKPAARFGDMTAHGGSITGPGVPTVLKPTNEISYWKRGADIIFKPGHIVFTAEDEPDVLNNNVSFLIMQECGSVNSSVVTVFRRKLVRSPFTWWGNSIRQFTFGKVFVWR